MEETTGSTPTPEPASSPAPSAPAADVKPARPSSFREALRQGEKDAASSPTSTPASADSPAAATVLPTDAGAAKELPPVPHARFNEVIDQRKAAEKRAAEFEQQLAALKWAQGVDQNAALNSMRWQAFAHANPEAFFEHAIRTAPPEILPRVRSQLARWLATRTDPRPDADFQIDTGQKFYSADQIQKVLEWHERQQEAKFGQQLEPMRRELSEQRTQREQAHAEAQSKAFASTAVEQAHAWPFFSEHIQEIAEEYAKQPMGRGTPEEELLALGNAWRKVLAEKVLPSISQHAQAQAVADFKTKAAASSEQPGRATTTNPAKPKSMRESLERAAAAANWRP